MKLHCELFHATEIYIALRNGNDLHRIVQCENMAPWVTLKSCALRIYKIHKYCLTSIFVVWKLDIANLCFWTWKQKFIVCHKFKLDFEWFLIFFIVASKRDNKYLKNIALINNLKPIIIFSNLPVISKNPLIYMPPDLTNDRY